MHHKLTEQLLPKFDILLATSFYKDILVQSVHMAGHNTSLFVLGVMILWFGWYGFNPGSQLAIVTPSGSTYSIASAVSNAAVTTSLAPASAGLTGLFVTAILLKMKTGKHHWDIMAMGNSTLAGLPWLVGQHPL